MKKLLFAGWVFLFSIRTFSQPITISGLVRDSVTLAPLDSTRIDIVNVTKRYMVSTNTIGVSPLED